MSRKSLFRLLPQSCASQRCSSIRVTVVDAENSLKILRIPLLKGMMIVPTISSLPTTSLMSTSAALQKLQRLTPPVTLFPRRPEKAKTTQTRTPMTRGTPKPPVTIVARSATFVQIVPSSRTTMTRTRMLVKPTLLLPRALKTVSLSTRRRRKPPSLSLNLKQTMRTSLTNSLSISDSQLPQPVLWIHAT